MMAVHKTEPETISMKIFDATTRVLMTAIKWGALAYMAKVISQALQAIG